MLRARETWLWSFLMPVLFMYVIGTTAGGLGRRVERETLALLAPPDSGFLLERLQSKLEADYRIVRVRERTALARHRRRLELPPGFTQRVLEAQPVTVRLELGGEGLANDYDRFRVQRAVYGLLAELIVVSRSGAGISPDALARYDAKPRPLAFSVEPAGSRPMPPRAFDQAVPGIMVQFLILTLLITGGVWLVMERNQGILSRLAATPLDPRAMVAAKAAARWTLGLGQAGYAMLVGRWLFGVRWGEHWPAVVGFIAFYAALAAMLGVLLGIVARTERQVVGLGVFSADVLAALGGCWWPIEITPPWAQKLALFLPTGWAMDGLHRLVSFGQSPAAILPHSFAPAAATAGVAWAANRSFRWD
ncbi:MAG: ABC transporter permease [Bryobacteraceae bacterium]|nr:ABC transporter permease [Bryobacteraceae bacterium]